MAKQRLENFTTTNFYTPFESDTHWLGRLGQSICPQKCPDVHQQVMKQRHINFNSPCEPRSGANLVTRVASFKAASGHQSVSSGFFLSWHRGDYPRFEIIVRILKCESPDRPCTPVCHLQTLVFNCDRSWLARGDILSGCLNF